MYGIETATLVKRKSLYAGYSSAYCHALEIGTFPKRINTKSLNAVWDNDVYQTATLKECLLTNTCHTVRDNDTCKTGTSTKCALTYGGDPGWNIDTL